MKKYLFVVVAAMIPLLVAIPVRAAIIDSGTTVFDFGGGSSTSVDWKVYDPGTAPFATTGAGMIYTYTLNGWAGYSSAAILNIFNGFGTLNGAGLSATPGVSATVSQVPSAPAGGTFGLMQGSLNGGAFGVGQSATFWWTSTMGPKTTSATLSTSAAVTPGTGRIVAPDAVTGPPPGVPEPQTWALLIAMMGFAVLWMRRREDDNAPLETAVAA